LLKARAEACNARRAPIQAPGSCSQQRGKSARRARRARYDWELTEPEHTGSSLTVVKHYERIHGSGQGNRSSGDHFGRELGLRLRIGPGPVFTYEWLTATRRKQFFALRAGFVSVILVGLVLSWWNGPRRDMQFHVRQRISIQELASFGESLYKSIVLIELTLVLLAAPAATAGAVCLDKARGTLDHILATELTDAEIIMGKLGARLLPVLGLIACVLPVTALAGLIGGIDPTTLFGSFLVAIACAALGCSLAVALSVWGRKTQDVLTLTYLIILIWTLSAVLADSLTFSLGSTRFRIYAVVPRDWFLYSNPYYLIIAPYVSPGRVDLTTHVLFLGACLLLSSLLVGLATLGIRKVAMKQAE
jgi:hypothetical protein